MMPPMPPSWAAPVEDGQGIELRRAQPGERAFGLEVTLFRKGAFSKAVQLMYGFGAAARAEAEALAAKQAERLTMALAACKTAATRVGVGLLHTMLAAELERHGASWRAHGEEVFFGRQHDPERKNPSGKWPAYIPKAKQGGLAARLGVCVATVYRYWSVLVKHGVWDAVRPPRDGTGVRLTKTGSQVYTQRWLVGGTPKSILDRLPIFRTKRAAKRPNPRPGVRLRADELVEAQAYIDGRTVELPETYVEPDRYY